jgi:hypothetical protein
MKGKVRRERRLIPDYPFISAIFAILVSVAVLVGITYRYALRSDPADDLASRLNAPVGLPPHPSEL